MDTRIQAAIEDRKKRWADFYDPNNPPRHMLLIRLTENTPARPLPHPDKKQQRIEWAWMQYLAQMKRVAWLDDDTMPYLDVYTGTEIFAEVFGCSVHRPEDNMPFALPFTPAKRISHGIGMRRSSPTSPSSCACQALETSCTIGSAQDEASGPPEIPL